jgi:hypothetical protein
MGIAFKVFSLIQKDKISSEVPHSSRLVAVFHPLATDNSGGKDNINLNENIVKLMVDEGIKAFTGQKSLKEAWRVIIPDPEKKVAIKINCQIKGIFTKAKVVRPILCGLILADVSPDNIIIYDATDNAFEYAGFKKNLGGGIKVGTVADFGGYSRFFFERFANLLIGGYQSSFLNFLSQLSEIVPNKILKSMISRLLAVYNNYDCDYIINVPVLKALDVCSGVTLSMKNHYGSIANPGSHHKDVMHFLPYLNSLPPLSKKSRLILLDAIFCEYRWQNSRSQEYVSETDKIVISDDPVAIDYFGWKLIEKEREKNGLRPLPIEPQFINNAARLGLGNNNPELFNYLEINLPTQESTGPLRRTS